ncbi:uncharacterized protein LOC118180601, partial [Stegodyphus dumicola]|uniref:uncharacterized protein LOC118180601 n=1 Tax=Stegodyphus dumicola TaxID=202533 RepID=UPI0015B245D6
MALKEYVSAFINTLLVTLRNLLQNLHDFIRKYNPFPESETLEKEAVLQSCSLYSGSGISYINLVILLAMFAISTALAAHKWKHWRELFDSFAVGSIIYTMFSLKKYIFAAIDSIISSIQ